MNAAPNNNTVPETTPTAAPAQPERQEQAPALQDSFNPMADIIERHENAVNRLKRKK